MLSSSNSFSASYFQTCSRLILSQCTHEPYCGSIFLPMFSVKMPSDRLKESLGGLLKESLGGLMVMGGDVHVEYMKHTEILREIFLKVNDIFMNGYGPTQTKLGWGANQQDFPKSVCCESGNGYTGFYHAYEYSEQCEEFTVTIYFFLLEFILQPLWNTGFRVHCELLFRVLWCSIAQLCPTLWDTTNHSPTGFSIHGIFQARIL